MLTDTTFANNAATFGAGGAYFVVCENATLTGITFTGNTAEVCGGALFEECENATLTGTSFTDNTATYYGGGAYFVVCGNATLTGMTFENNRAEFLLDSGPKATFSRIDFGPETAVCGSEFRTMAAIDGEPESYGGGALFGGCENVMLTDATFTGNTADDGGGAWFEECGNATLSDTSFTDNTATYYGGGVEVYRCNDVTLTGNTFTGNTAEYGGGAYFEWCENATLTDATFTGNTAGDGGGAEVYLCNDVTLNGITFTGNTAEYGGGADVWDCNDVTLNGNTFTDNTAEYGGGADVWDCNGVTLTSNTFTGNTAEYGGGTGFYECENVTLAGATFANNAATFGGGAYFEWCENATLTDATFTDNTVTDPGDGPVPQSSESSEDEFESSGGGIFLYESSGATITNCCFDNLDNICAVRDQDEESDIRESDFVDRFFAVLNTTRKLGTNIAGGPYLGGNLWLNDPEQNISEWGTDADFDGICDEPLTLYWNDGEEFGTDHLPLVYGGTVAVTSTPVGASVHLDGMTIGRTNDASIYLPVGDYNVTVTLDGYVTPAHRTVSVVPGETVSVAFALEPVSTSSSGSGGGHSDLAAGSAGDIPAGGSGILTFQGQSIYEIKVTAGESIRTILITIGRTGLPSSVEAPAGQVFEYDEVTLYHTTDDAIEGVYIFFKIPKEWLEKKGLDPADVVLYRYHDGAWQALATEVVEEDETFWHFSAWSQGFSLFAIGGDPTPVEVKVPDAGAEAGTTDPIPPVTPDKPTPPPTESTTPFPTTLLLICGAAVLIIAAVLFWKRR